MSHRLNKAIEEMKRGRNRDFVLRELAGEFMASMLDAGLGRTCLNCDKWVKDDKTGQHYGCGMVKKMPPPEILVNGCEKHTDIIPF